MLVSSLKRISRRVHQAVGTSRWLTTLYLESLGTASRSLLPKPMSARVLNGVKTAGFLGDVSLAPRKVRLGGCTCAWLQPHLGEFDLEALFSRALSYEQETMAFIAARMHRYEFVLEIGANVGVYTVLFARHLQRLGRSEPVVYCFEPASEAFHRLQVNLRLNALTSAVQPYQAAVSVATGLAPFFEPLGHLTNGSLRQDFAAQFSQDVRCQPVITLGGEQVEQLLTGKRGRFLLKIDVEGGELDVLDALSQAIGDRQPDILIEVLPDAARALESHEALSGYRRFEIGAEGAIARAAIVASSNRDWFLSRDP